MNPLIFPLLLCAPREERRIKREEEEIEVAKRDRRRNIRVIVGECLDD